MESNPSRLCKGFSLLKAELSNEFSSPSEEFVKLIGNRVYQGRMTQQIKDQFTNLLRRAIDDYVRARVDSRLKSALETSGDYEAASGDAPSDDMGNDEQEFEDGIETTEEELMACNIIRAIVSEIADPDRVFLRDAKSYCAILFDDNNRKTISRLRFGKKRMVFSVFDDNGEQRTDIEKLNDIYRFKLQIHRRIESFLDSNTEPKAQPADVAPSSGS